MFLKTSNFMFYTLLMMSTIMSISTNSWFVAWMMLEINLMMLIPLLINKVNFNSTNATIKYFLVQVFASMIMMFSFNMSFIFDFSNSILIYSELMTVTLMIKLGIPPFQFWLPQTLELVGMKIQSFMILTWQKVAPFIFLTYTNSMLISAFAMISATAGALGGLNQNSLPKIMAYSSMVHASWMMPAVIISEKTWCMYFLAYSVILASIFFFCFNFKVKKISNIFNVNLSMPQKITFSMNILSMGGMPPLLGFSAKIMIITNIISSKMMMLSIILISASFISLLYYTRICYSIFLNKTHKMKTMKKSAILKNNFYSMVSVMGNIIVPMIMLFI